MKVKVISVLEDNYMYLVIEENTRDAIAVDAAVPKRLLEIIRKEDVALRAILTTHHHWDHARGNEELAQLCPGLHVYGSDERIGALTHKVTHNQELTFGAIRVRCLFTPCHTSGHMCYFMWEDGSPDAPALFSGDTLFVGGCGKFFEGTAEQMFTNLTQTLGTLPKETVSVPCLSPSLGRDPKIRRGSRPGPLGRQRPSRGWGCGGTGMGWTPWRGVIPAGLAEGVLRP